MGWETQHDWRKGENGEMEEFWRNREKKLSFTGY
jgi:hypothetical protein